MPSACVAEDERDVQVGELADGLHGALCTVVGTDGR